MRSSRRFSPLSLCAISLLLLLAACGSNEEPGANATSAQLLEWADASVGRDELDRAIVGYRRALGGDSLNVAALLGLARVYTLQERQEPAERYQRRAFHVRYHEGLAHMAAGTIDSAQSSLKDAIDIIPHHPLAHLRLGELKRDAGQIDSAIVHFERAVEANPRFAESLIILAKAYEKAQRSDDARKAYERAIEANINALDAYLGLGRIFRAGGEWAAAASQFEKVLLIDPRSTVGLSGLEEARLHLRQGR